MVRWNRWSVRHDARQVPLIAVIICTSGTISWRQDVDNVNSFGCDFWQPIDKVQRPLEHVEIGNDGR